MPQPTRTPDGGRGPLADVLVLDLTRALSGPHAAMMLGDLGARVIKVESPVGDDSRHWGPPFLDAGGEPESTYFMSANRNKESVVLDLKSVADRALLERTFELPVRLFPASDYAGVIQAFGAKQLDIANMSPAAYAGAWLDTNGGVEPLVTTEEADGSVSYVAVMLVRADSGITSIEGMRGKAMAWSVSGSPPGT